MGFWTHHNMWLLFIVGLQFGLLRALAPDSNCNPSTEFSCRNNSSICIPLSRVKDGTPDCADKSDEECNEKEFQCQSIHQCIPRERFHDGWPDCDDGSDEECGRGQFRCRCGVPHCIEGSKVKDGTKDCEDGSDEVSEKSRNKTARCPDESRLQDLLAVEKRRRKRQIHAFGATFSAEDLKPPEDMPLNLQTSMTGTSSNNFQYSYTKFLNERLSRDRYNQEEEESISEDRINTPALEDRRKTLSTKPFMVRTETDQYGSLNSGKIYQTAVNEPVSVFPTAEATLLKFDNLKTEKKFLLKLKKDNGNEPRRLSDLMLKIAALFQNDSETRTVPKTEANEDLKNKSSKNMKNRKLLSFPFDEQESDIKHRNKRGLPDSEPFVSHVPLLHSPTVPYMPQSDVHTTGIVMSTTGTDIINGRTTEWTTVVEGTFISGTYAHIVHSTSRIYYTVETLAPSMTTEKIQPTESFESSNMKITESVNNVAHSKNSQEISSTSTTKETNLEKSSRSQRINDKSLRERNTLTNNSSSSQISNEFKIKPTPSFSDEFDITTMKDEVNIKDIITNSTSNNMNVDEFDNKTMNDEVNIKDIITSSTSNNMNVDEFDNKTMNDEVNIKDIITSSTSNNMAENSFRPEDNDSVLSMHEIPILDLKPTEVTHSILSEKTTDEDVFNFTKNISEILSLHSDKNVDLRESKSITSENKPFELNIIGRMVGNISSDIEADDVNLSNESGTVKSTSEKSIEDNEFSTSTSLTDLEDFTILKDNNTSFSNTNETKELNFEFSNTEAQLSSGILKKDDIFETPRDNTAVEEMSRTETILRVPDITDLLMAFMPASTESSISETILHSEAEAKLETIPPITSSLFDNKMTKNEEESSMLLNNSDDVMLPQINETQPVMFIFPTVLNISDDIDLLKTNRSISNESLNEAIKLNTLEISTSVLEMEASVTKEELNSYAKDTISDPVSDHTSPIKESEVMVFLGIASTLDMEEIAPTTTKSPSSPTDIIDIKVSDSDTITHINHSSSTKISDENLKSEASMKELNEKSDITVLLLPSMGLNDLKNLMSISLSSSMFLPETVSISEDFRNTQSTKMTPVLEDSISIDKIETEISENSHLSKTVLTSLQVDSITEKATGRAKRAVSESVTILKPEGRIVSTDAIYYLTPTTLYTTYTYFTTMLIPGRGSTVHSSLHVDSIVVQPTDRAVHGIDDHVQPCYECRIRNTPVHDEYETQNLRRPIIRDHYTIETVPYDAGRQSEITHRTTYTYYTTRFRGGTSFIETRKETKTNVTPLSTGRYSPFEIGTYYDGDLDDHHYHTEAPRIAVTGTRVRPGYETRQTVRPSHPTYSQRIDPNLYKPDRVTHRTTYTYHTTRIRDGVPIVNTRKETETNVTPIPTYTRPGYRERQTVHRGVPSRRVTHYPEVVETRYPHVYQGSNPDITHRTTYTYFTTRLIGGSTHVDTRYVTETNVTPNPAVPYVRGTAHAHAHPHYDDGYYETDCPVCRETQRTTITRQVPHNIIRGRNTAVEGRRSDIVNPEVRPSTATLFSTYTYATTQLTRGGIPVVRTREHTVTEVLSDVVLPTLKFGDRIRSKRTLKPEDVAAKDTVHVVPIRHTFSRTNSYADGRQGRRIPIDDQNHHRPNRINSQHGHTENKNKEHGRHNPENLNKHDDIEIRPTNITYYSTYTYFTTELHDGTPEIKTREHTVTEILTDVIVPTVSEVRKHHITRAYAYSDHKRHARDLQVLHDDNAVPLRKLLTVSSDDETTTSTSVFWHLQPNSILPVPEASTRISNIEESITLTPPLQISNSEIVYEKKESGKSSKSIDPFRTIESDTDFTPAGAEIRRVFAEKPITHYTTYTYYTTKIKPGGSRIVETSTKVSSSVTYPNPTNSYNQVQHTREPYNNRKLYADRSAQRSQFQPPLNLHTSRNSHQADNLHELGSQAIHQFGRPYRGQPVLVDTRVCASCDNQRFGNRNSYGRTSARISNLQKDSHLTRVPVRNRNNNARRIPDRAPNDVYYPDSNIKPTHVTYYSTYTYFTTEPIDGSSVVRSREHTVTEVLTNVIVPTVASLNKVQTTHYPDTNHNRFKRESTEDSIKEVLHKKWTLAHKRKLLSLEAETLPTDDFLLKEIDNFTASTHATKENFSDIGDNESYALAENYVKANENFTLYEENFSISNSSLSAEPISFQENEPLNNITLNINENFTLLKESLPTSNDSLSEKHVSLNGKESLNNITINTIETTSNVPENVIEVNLSSEDSQLNNKTEAMEDQSTPKEDPVSPLLKTFEEDSLKISTSTDYSSEKKSTEYSIEKVTVFTEHQQNSADILTINIVSNSNNDKSDYESKILPTTSTVFATSTVNLKTNREGSIHPSTPSYSESINSHSDAVRSSFRFDNIYLNVMDTSLYPIATEALNEDLDTANDDKTQITKFEHFLKLLQTSSNTDKASFPSEDLEAEGAEVRHAVIATPTTHFTTYTYYSTVLKPGGKREVVTNTKVTSSTYFQSEPLYMQSVSNHAIKPERQRTHRYTTKLYDLHQEGAIVRPQYTPQNFRNFKPYAPSFSTKARRPVYKTLSAESTDRRCLTCNTGDDSHVDYYRQNRHVHHRNNNYLTSVPVRRMNTNYYKAPETVPYNIPTAKSAYAAANIATRRLYPHHQRIPSPNTIPYDVPEIKPTRVTYYSTYTYFTTELQNGSPVVRSREHTVTEILTDVIVPTVTSFSHARNTRYPNLRGKRDTDNDDNFNNIAINSPLHRKLLSIDDSISEVSLKEDNETNILPKSDSSEIINPIINDDASLENNLLVSLKSEYISPTSSLPSTIAPDSVKVSDDFLNNAQFSKAFAAYLAFLESSGTKSENLTVDEEENGNFEKIPGNSKNKKSSKDSHDIESNVETNSPESNTKNMMSVMTTNVKKNGKLTKYTTTIYGTYINGVYAQRAKSTSDVISITEMDASLPFTSLMFSPSRLPGLVRSIVSRKIRGPVAVHLTTEIHGTFVGGAYAQTARVFTNSQPLSSTREPSRHRVQSYSTTVPSGTRKTGLLSTRILRSKVNGPTTLLFVSEIYGTHIGGAYAHLGTYTTRTIIHTSSSTVSESELTSTPLSTYYMEDLTTGLVTASVSEKELNGVTTRYHYEVYGTYLDGTYAHVPSISTETLTPRSVCTLSPSILMSSSDSFSDIKSTETEMTIVHSSKHSNITNLKVGLIHASTRAHVRNGTTTQHIFEVHGTYLDGNYAHVPSVSVVTITPSNALDVFETLNVGNNSETKVITETESLGKVHMSSEFKNLELNLSDHTELSSTFKAFNEANSSASQSSEVLEQSNNFTSSMETDTFVETFFIAPVDKSESTQIKSKEDASLEFKLSSEPDFEVLTIFSDIKSDNGGSISFPSEDITIFSLELNENPAMEERSDEIYEILDIRDISPSSSYSFTKTAEEDDSKSAITEDDNQQSSNIFPILLPEALRLSFSHNNANHRVKRNDPFSPYLRSSFTDSIKSQTEIQHTSLVVTTPLPASVFGELSKEFLENATKIYPSSKTFKNPPQTKSRYKTDGRFKEKSIISKSITNSKAKLFYLKRSKRAAIRSAFGSNKRFGASSSNSRKFSSTKSFKSDSNSPNIRSFRPSSSIIPRNTISATKSMPTLRSKSIPNFLGRSQRPKPALISKSSSSLIKITPSSNANILQSIRIRRFGKKEPDNLSKMEEDFDASEAIPRSVTEEKIDPSTTSTNRFRRPSKFSKFNVRPSSTSTSSRLNKIISPTSSRRSRLQTKNISSRNRKINYKDFDQDIRPTETIDPTSSKRRFTLTTTFEINLKSTAGYLMPLDTDDGNNLQIENGNSKRRNKNRNSNRNRQGSSYKPVFDSDENEVKPDKPKSLPLPVFGRSRGVKRPPKFDPRTIKATPTPPTSTIIYLDSSANDTRHILSETELNGPITVTDVFTTIKTLPVHLGQRTSFATITTTAFTTSTIQPEDLTLLTLGGITKTIVSAKTGLPDMNMPADKQFTVVTEVILTTTEIESTSLVAIKVGFGTRTDTIVTKQKMTTLLTQTNTILEEKTASLPYQQQYPFFPNPFAPPLPPQNTDFSLSLTENSFVSTQVITSTTVLPLFFNGKTIFTTLTSTSLTEETLTKTTTFKVPQQPTMQPFIFPQPVFILPSVTTELTIQFTAHNGEIYSIVTQITVPLALNGHTRFARSVIDATVNPTSSSSFAFSKSTHGCSSNLLQYSASSCTNYKDLALGTILESSFSINNKQPLTSESTQSLVNENSRSVQFSHSELQSTYTLKHNKIEKETSKFPTLTYKNFDNEIGLESYNFRKLLQFIEDEVKHPGENTNSSLEPILDNPSTQSSTVRNEDDLTYVPDTFHLIGPGFNEEEIGRPIPSVRVVPTRRAYVRRLKPSGSQNLPFDGSDEEFNFRRNNQNSPPNLNGPRGAEFSNIRPGGLRRNVPIANRPFISPDGSNGNFGTVRNIQYFSQNRPNQPPEFDGDVFSPSRLQPNFVANRPNRLSDGQSNAGRNIPNFLPSRNNRRPQSDGFDALRSLPSYTPTRQNFPQIPPREESTPNSNQFGEELTRNQINRPQPAVTTSPRRVIRLRRPVNSQQARPQSGRELLDRKPIINALPDEKESIIRGRGPVDVRSSGIVRDVDDSKVQGDSNDLKYTEPLPLTYYTTFTYMTTFLNGPSTAYSTREAIVSNIATESVNPRIVDLIRTRGGFNNGIQTAVPLGSRAQGATTTIVNLASRVQLYNSDIYYGKNSKLPHLLERDEIMPTAPNLRTIPITDVASLPKTYYTLFTYFYTLRDGDKSSHSQRSETVSNIDTQTDPFVMQDFASTIDSSGFLTLKPNKQIVNLGIRTAGGTTTEVNLELKTVVHFDGLKNAVIDRGSMTPTLVEIFPSETNSILNNYLDPDDAEVQDQQTYPQTVPIQPSFSSANEVYAGTQRSPSSKDATPEIPSNSRIVRTQSIRGPLRIASTVLQRPGSLRSGVFAPRPGVRVRVRPVSSRITPIESPTLASSEPGLSSYTISFDPSRTVSEEENDFDDEEDDVTEEDNSADDYTTEDTKSTEEEKGRQPLPGRKRLKITIRRSPGVSASRTNSAFIRPTRTRPRFYVVTRTASPTGGPVRQPKRPVSVKVSRRLRPSGEPEYETYTTMTSVPVVFGLSTTYRNALVTSSSLITSDDQAEPSKTVVLTYFTTTTYTVPYTVDGIATYTTLEETNSRIATETLDPDADLSFISTTTIDYADEISASSSDLVRHPPQTLKPQLVNNQLNVGPRINLATKVSNGVTLIVASDGENEATQVLSQPAVTLRPTVVTDALHMTNQFITTLYEPRTFYTTFTFFTTFFSSGTPSISTSEQVITNVYSVPVTQSLTMTQPATEPFTVIETSENLVSSTIYTTHTFYATLFNGTSTIVTPIEELQSSVISSTETYTITKTLMPQGASKIEPTTTLQPSLTTTSVYRTRTNFVTLFRGTESIVSPLEEIETDVITLTLDNRIEPSSLPPKESYTTRTIQATNTHYITLFSGSESILSSITEVAPSVITELVKQLQEPTTTPFVGYISIQPTSVLPSSPSSIEPIFQDLVPSIRTQYTTLTYFTTLFTDSSTILSSREEVATSYITLFVPAPAPGATTVNNAGIFTSQAEMSSSKSSDIKASSVKPTSEILTFYTTYTYYTTLFRGTETIISDSETVVTQYVTIETTPTDSVSRHTTSLPPTFSRPNYSDSFEIRTEPSPSPTIASSTESSKSKETSDEDLKIIGVSTKVESASETPSIITGIPSTDANGATHILFTDFIVPSSIDEPPSLSTELYSEYVTPSLSDLVSSINIITEPTSVSFEETTFFPHESSTPSSARESAASDLPTTRLTDVNVATHHMVLHPTTTYQSGSSQTLGLKPGAVIDLSDVLTNTNLVGNLGETIKDIVNLFAANGNRAGKNSTSKSSQSSSDTSVVLPSGGITISSAEDPVFIPIGAIARSTKAESSRAEENTDAPQMKPSTMLSGFTPLVTDERDANNRKVDSVNSIDLASGTLTSIVFGSNTIFIQPTAVKPDVPATIMFSEMDGRFHSSFDTNVLRGSESSQENSEQQATPGIKQGESTTLITGLETIFFGFPDARQPPQATTQVIQGSGSTSSIVGYETIFFDSPKDFFVPGSNRVNITGATTIFGTFPILTETSTSSTITPQSTFTSTSSGETTIFFPVPGDNQQQNPGTRYVTSVESVTLTLTLTTSSVYQTEDTPVTVTSVFTTTIPPRTFVSTIIGDRTILGTQPEPTEAVQVIPTMQPSESTTTVTTTTLIFNSIATTVVRTLVIPTNGIQPTRPLTSEATDIVKLGGVGIQPKSTTERPRRPIQLFKSGNRPTDPTTPKPQRTGPPLKLFPTKPPTTTTLKPPPRPVTTRKNTFRKPGKTLVPITDGCLRECNLKNKEVCKQNNDKTWSCQCRPGFFKKNGSEECRDVKSFVVLVRVLKMGDNDVTYSADLSNHLSAEYKNLTTTARKAVDDAYKTSSVGDDFVSTNVISVARDRGLKPEGVLVNLTVQLTGEKPANEEFLKEELANSLEAASSELSLSNASVSPIIQRVEDVQDFDECYDDSYNDCSRSAICVNLPGTYTCECKDGYQDLEPLLPGRICSGEIKDCDYCNNRGVCIMTEDDNKFCRCYRMYLGKQCEINGLVLAIALPIALALLILTMFCLLCGCRKLRQRKAQKPKQNVFKGMAPPMAGTLDRKAMIMDSSSESSGEHRPPAHAYDGFSDDVANSTMKRSRRSDNMMDDHISEFQVPTVLIPRAKHSHPKQVNAPYPNYRMPHGDMDRW